MKNSQLFKLEKSLLQEWLYPTHFYGVVVSIQKSHDFIQDTWVIFSITIFIQISYHIMQPLEFIIFIIIVSSLLQWQGPQAMSLLFVFLMVLKGGCSIINDGWFWEERATIWFILHSVAHNINNKSTLFLRKHLYWYRSLQLMNLHYLSYFKHRRYFTH